MSQVVNKGFSIDSLSCQSRDIDYIFTVIERHKQKQEFFIANELFILKSQIGHIILVILIQLKQLCKHSFDLSPIYIHFSPLIMLHHCHLQLVVYQPRESQNRIFVNIEIWTCWYDGLWFLIVYGTERSEILFQEDEVVLVTNETVSIKVYLAEEQAVDLFIGRDLYFVERIFQSFNEFVQIHDSFGTLRIYLSLMQSLNSHFPEMLFNTEIYLTQQMAYEFFISNSSVIIFVVSEHIFNNILQLTWIFIQNVLKGIHDLLFLKFQVPIRVECCQYLQHLPSHIFCQLIVCKLKLVDFSCRYHSRLCTSLKHYFSNIQRQQNLLQNIGQFKNQGKLIKGYDFLGLIYMSVCGRYNYFKLFFHNMAQVIVLKKNNENRFSQLWSSFAKSEANAMRLSEYTQFIIDRCLVNNRTTIKHLYNLFIFSTEKRLSLEIPVNNSSQGSNLVEKTINKQQFIFLLNELGKYVYHNDQNQQDRVYNDLLGQKSHAEKDFINYPRIMIMDEINRKLMMENVIKTISSYEDELKSLFLIYLNENYWSLKKQNRLLLSQREVDLQNKKMTAVSLVRLLKEAEILPHLINIEHVEQIISRVVPHINPKENEFYSKHYLVDYYSKDIQNSDLKNQGDPGLQLFEFIFVIARIAIETSKQMDNAKKVYDLVLAKFFSNYLYLRSNDQINTTKLPEFNKPYLVGLKKYYTMLENQIENGGSSSEQEQEYNPFQQLKQKQLALQKLEPLQFHIPSMIRALNAELPPMPPQMQVKQEIPPPFAPKFKDIPKVTIGQQPPPQKLDKNKANQKVQPKIKQLKKGEKPPRIFKYNEKEQQTTPVVSSEDYLQKLATDLDYSLKPLSSLERGNIPLDPFPSVISQILYPPEVPEKILPFIEAAINAHNDGAYALALENYQKAYKLWKQDGQMSQSLQLYFQFSKGGVYLSAGKDDYAFNSFFLCRNFLEKIQYLNPDRALPYCGLGQALYNAEEYELAARCYLKARQIREALLGIQSVDTVTTFNNIGCCFFMLDRPKEALSYFKISRQVMIYQLGEFHERSQTTRENVNLCNKAFYENTPQYRKLWQVFEKDVFGKKKKKKKKDDKKK